MEQKIEHKFSMRLTNPTEVERLRRHFKENEKLYGKSMSNMLRRFVLLGIDVFEDANSDEQKLIETSQISQKIDKVIHNQNLIIKELSALGDKVYIDSELGQLLLNNIFVMVKDLVLPDGTFDAEKFKQGFYHGTPPELTSKKHELLKALRNDTAS